MKYYIERFIQTNMPPDGAIGENCVYEWQRMSGTYYTYSNARRAAYRFDANFKYRVSDGTNSWGVCL